MARPRVVAIVGPTATGKSALAIALAHRFDGEVVSCDSTAVYRRFDIGTDKVPLAARQGVPHHLIDVADPTERYSASRWAAEAKAWISEAETDRHIPLIVGGTGFYIKALFEPLFDAPPVNRTKRQELETWMEQRS